MHNLALSLECKYRVQIFIATHFLTLPPSYLTYKPVRVNQVSKHIREDSREAALSNVKD